MLNLTQTLEKHQKDGWDISIQSYPNLGQVYIRVFKKEWGEKLFAKTWVSITDIKKTEDQGDQLLVKAVEFGIKAVLHQRERSCPHEEPVAKE